jgi:uroporphyrin-III C-methyltransferase
MPNPRHRPPIPAESAGKIHLLGAGPGDPNLLTLEAIKLFNSASLVVADRLIAQEILDLIPCELKVANKRPGCAEEAQEEIYDWCYSALKEGRHVVRLKIGDVFLFGRGGEEILEFRKWGIESNISPGISSSYSAPLAAGIPLTHRGVSNQVIISTGYGQDSKDVDVPEYVEDRTVVLLMAVGRIAAIAKRLVMKGYPTSTPVAIIEKATTPRQRTLYGTLEDIGDIAKREEAKPPATIVIGDVVHVLDA